MRVKKGSAILIALFVMATLGMLALLSSRIYVSEANTSSNLSAGTSAYYIAEGVLEKSLLDYRINNDVQRSFQQIGLINIICDTEQTPTQNCQAQKNDQMEDVTSDLKFALPANDTTKAYSRITYLGDKYKCYDEDNNCGDLPKDETIQVVVPKSVSTVTLHWSNSSDESRTNILRTSFSSYDNSGKLANYSHDSGETYKILPAETSHSVSVPSGLANNIIIRFRPLNTDLDNYWLSYTGDTGSIIDTGETTIDALGQVGGISRQLQVVIDRSKNGLNSLFDYTIFATDSDITD